MSLENIVFSPVPIADLISQLREVIKQEVLAAQKLQQDERLISVAEACKLFVPAISRPTLEKLSSEGKITKRHLNSRVYYKQSEVLEAAKVFKKYVQH